MKVVGIAGRAGSGKSTAAEGFPGDWDRVNFADPLKHMLVEAGVLTEEQAHGDEKEAPLDWLDGVTPRRVMQAFGTEIGRSIHPELWVRLWRRTAEEVVADGYGVVAADVRFPNEVAAIRALGGEVVWIERPGLAAADGHASENSISPDDCDVVILNDGNEWMLRLDVRSAVGA